MMNERIRAVILQHNYTVNRHIGTNYKQRLTVSRILKLDEDEPSKRNDDSNNDHTIVKHFNRQIEMKKYRNKAFLKKKH